MSVDLMMSNLGNLAGITTIFRAPTSIGIGSQTCEIIGSINLFNPKVFLKIMLISGMHLDDPPAGTILDTATLLQVETNLKNDQGYFT